MKRGKKQAVVKKNTRQKQKIEKKNKKTKKAEVKTKYDKTVTPLKAKAKKVLGSNEKKKTEKKKKKNMGGLTASQMKQLGDHIAYFSKKTTNELKELLKKNVQVCSGNKDDLIERCAQGKLLGALPTCPTCFTGKLRYNINTGEYKCPGYMDDTDFKFCKFRSSDPISRNPWQD